MKIKFIPQNITIEGSSDKSLLELAFENQIPIKSICKGVPSCGECRIKIVEGENNVNPPSRSEQSILGNNYFLDGRRLSCQMRCFGDVVIDMQEQFTRDDNQNKKIRGFKSNKQYESKAVLDTMILKEKPDETSDKKNQKK